MNNIKNIHIFGGGTVAHISNHFAACAPAYGTTAKRIAELISFDKRFDTLNVHLELTKMAGGKLETNEDIANRINELKADSRTKIIIFNCALVDYTPTELIGYYEDETKRNLVIKTSKYENRLNTSDTPQVNVEFRASEKIIPNIRTGRKDIFLVGFKTTCNATKQEMYEKGLNLCKTGSVNLVLVNDTKTRHQMIITPEEAAYHETDNREEILTNLIDMVYYRSHLTFVKSTVISGTPISWNSELIPSSIKTVVDYFIKKGSYKEFNGATVGHFGIALNDTEFLTSIRKTNFNKLNEIGLVKIKTDGPDTIYAYGAKPSVGGQSQRIVFNTHQGYDCIFHAHIPLKQNHPDNIPIVSQRSVECGSVQCGMQTANALKAFENNKIKVVMLDNHGPNILFNKNTDPQLIINFIERNFDSHLKTGGYQI